MMNFDPNEREQLKARSAGIRIKLQRQLDDERAGNT